MLTLLKPLYNQKKKQIGREIVSYITLQRYMISEDAIVEEAIDPKAIAKGAYLFCGAILAMPFIAAGLTFLSDKLKKMSEQKKKNALNGNGGNTNKKYEDATPHINSLNNRHAVEVTAEMQNRLKFLQSVVKIIRQIGSKHKCSWFSFDTGELETYIASIKTGKYRKDSSDFDVMECNYLTDVLPAIHPKDSSYDPEWAWLSHFSVDIFGYDIWNWVEAHPECTNARDFDQTREFWEEENQIIKEFAIAFGSSDFFYSIDCGGDWDDGSMCLVMKPSDNILSLANRETKYRPWPKAPKR